MIRSLTTTSPVNHAEHGTTKIDDSPFALHPFSQMTPDVEAVLDLITPHLLEQIIRYNTDEFDSFWEPQHIEAVDSIYEYIQQTYGHRINGSLFKAADKLKTQINNIT